VIKEGALITILIFFCGSLSQAQTSARDIGFKGLLPEDSKAVQKRFATVLSTGASLSEIDEMIRFLFKTNHYDMVEAKETRTNGRNGYLLVGFPVEIIEELEVVGNEAVDDDEIAEKLEIQVGKRSPKSQITQLLPNLEEFYRSRGYLNAQVKVEFKPLSLEKIKVLVKVDEGLPCKIQDVVVETSNEQLRSKLSNLIKRKIKDIYLSSTMGDIRQRITEFFIENRYLNANLSEPELKFTADKSGVTIRLAIENPYEYLITYDGNAHFSSVQLSKALRLGSNERFGLNPSAELADRLRIFYLKKGFANVKVAFEERILPRDYIKKLKLKVDEGPRVRIRSIEVSGKISRDSDYYADFIETHSSDLIDLGYYNLEDLELGYKNLVTELQNQGFLQAKLQSARTEFVLKGEFVNIKVFIDEGPQTRIKEISFKGVTAFKEKDLLEVINLREGAPLNLKAFEASIPRLREHYLAQGYLDMKINEDSETLVRYNEINTEARIEYDVQEGPQVVVGSILIQGNEQTNEDVILREIDFKPGDILTSVKINESQFRLQQMGLFSGVVIRTLEANTQVAKRTVIIEATESNPGLFNIGASINNELGDQYGISVLAYSGIAYRNLMGTARAISLRGEMNYNLETRFTEYDLTASYLEPFVFNDRIRGRVNFTKSVRIFKVESSRTIGLETNQVSTSLEKDLSRTVKFTWNLWSLANTRKFPIRGGLATDTGSEEVLSIATIGPQLDWDLRDHPYLTTRGIWYRITGDYSQPEIGSTHTVHFYKVYSSLNTYLPLGNPKYVWANSLRGGYLQNLSNRSDGRVPEEVMFSLGGRSTIRGFSPLAIPPREEFLAAYPNLSRNNAMFVKTDSHYYLFKSELRFPFWGEFGGVIFYDGGSVKISGVHFEDEYRDAAGIGFRYNTPVGPVSAELAFKLDRKDTPVKEDPFRFHFSIGAF